MEKHVHVIDTGHRRVTITVEEKQFEVEITMRLSAYGGGFGDESQIQQIAFDAVKRYENETRLLVFLSNRSKLVGCRQPDGSWKWIRVTRDGGDDSTGGHGGSGHDDKPGKPPSAPSGKQKQRRAIQPAVVPAVAEDKESELVGV